MAPGGPHPDILNYAWRDYGNRVGAWYMLDAFDALRLPMAALVNSAMYDYAPDLVAACRARGDEIVGHGRTNAERQGILDEPGERQILYIGDAQFGLAIEDGFPHHVVSRLTRMLSCSLTTKYLSTNEYYQYKS